MVSLIAAVVSLLVLLASADIDQPRSTSNPKSLPSCSSEVCHDFTSIVVHDEMAWHLILGDNNSIGISCLELPDIRMGEDDKHRAFGMSFDNVPTHPENRSPPEDPRMA